MPTQIIDGFSLNAARPIDSRMVTSGEISRNSMSYRYVGLRVYDTTDKKSFVWDGTTWKEDGGGSDFKVTDTKPNYITKYTATGLTSSGIREVMVGQNRYVGVNISESLTPNATLHVGGTVCATTFCGSIGGNNITNNTISTQKLCNAAQAGNYVLKSVNNVVQWAPETGGAGGGGGASTELDTTTTTSFIAFANTTAATGYKVSCSSTNTFIGADLSTSQLTLSNTNNSLNPAYSFIDNKNTGFYGSSVEVGMSLGGVRRINANSSSTVLYVAGNKIIDARLTRIDLNVNTEVNGYLCSTSLTVDGVATINGDFTVSSGFNTSLGSCLSVSNSTTLGGSADIKGQLSVCGCTSMCTTVNTYAATIQNENVTGCALIVRHLSGCAIVLKESSSSSSNNANMIYYQKLDNTFRGSIGYETNKTYLSVKNGTATNVGETRFYSDDLKRRLKTNLLQVNNSMVYAGIYNLCVKFTVSTGQKAELTTTSKQFFDSAINTGFTTTSAWKFEHVITVSEYKSTFKITHSLGHTYYTPILSPKWATAKGDLSPSTYEFAGYFSVDAITANTFNLIIYSLEVGKTIPTSIEVDILMMVYTDDTNYDFY